MPDQSKATRTTDLSTSSQGPGFWARAGLAAKLIFNGDEIKEWFGPLRPLPPVVTQDQQRSVEGRQFDYQVGENLRYIPRANEAVSFWTMRQLAQWDILSIIINSRKDQLAKLEWTIEPRDKAKKKQSANLCQDVEQWWRRPDQRHTWREWIQLLLDDLLVIDAPCLYVNRNIGGDLFGFEPIDGSTIKPLIDAHGRRPLPPDFAYSQALHGTPAMLYTSEQMLYKPRVLRTHKIYGYSPVERIIITVNTALRRQVQQLDHFTEGSMPAAYVGVPIGDKGWTPKQLEEFSQRWNSKLSGNLAERARIQFGPDGTTWHEFKKIDLKDEFDEWLARVACAAYGVDPSPFIKQVNRGTQETTREAALAEGLAPYQVWIKELIDECLERQGLADLQFQWRDDEAIDPVEKANISKTLAAAGVLHPNEIRADDGRDPLDENVIAWLLAMQKSQSVVPPPSEWVDGQPPPAPVPAAPPQDPASAQAGAAGAAAPAPASAPKGKQQPAAGKGAAASPLGKSSRVTPINRERRIVKEASERIERALTKAFRKMVPSVSAQIAELLPNRAKAAGDQPPLDQVLTALQLEELEALATTLGTELANVTQDGARQGVKQVGVSIDMESPNEDALAWARARGAELVGKSYDEDGNLVDKPNADMAITDGTREHLRSLVAQAEEEGWSNNRLTQELRDSYAFSASRAEVIAHTETARADVQGNLIGWKASGVVASKQWTVGDGCCDECQDLDGVVVALEDQFPGEGGDGPPLHPQCRCDVSPVIDETQDAEEPATEAA
jgi:SPP1 gp7 family putative phage head morphogenesis protein